MYHLRTCEVILTSEQLAHAVSLRKPTRNKNTKKRAGAHTSGSTRKKKRDTDSDPEDDDWKTEEDDPKDEAEDNNLDPRYVVPPPPPPPRRPSPQRAGVAERAAAIARVREPEWSRNLSSEEVYLIFLIRLRAERRITNTWILRLMQGLEFVVNQVPPEGGQGDGEPEEAAEEGP